MRWWLRNLAVGAAAGLVVGLVVGGTLGRIFMRLVFLAREDALGLETAMGATVGELTAAGTIFIYVFGALFGALLGVGYAAGRTLLPPRTGLRTAVFTAGATALMLGQIVRGNREDFAFLPVTVSLLLVAGSVALTALPVPLVVERLTPDRPRRAGPVALGAVALALAGAAAFGATGILLAYE
jgi:hypothetical protein